MKGVLGLDLRVLEATGESAAEEGVWPHPTCGKIQVREWSIKRNKNAA